MTLKNIYILECKNMYGNISIDENGNFYRHFNKKIESIYNPITQLNRHMDIIKEYIYDKNGIIGKLLTNYAFDKYYKGLVVFTNDKMIIKDNKAPKKVKDKVIRLDKLVDYIKKWEKKSRNLPDSLEETKALANKILKLIVETEILDEVITTDVEYNEEDYNLNIILRNKLKKYRFNKSKELNYKPYFIFTDKSLNELVKKKPFNKEELKKVCGFSDIKIEKYGREILKIINN
jgi:superfamily II DNA helicase RecQ